MLFDIFTSHQRELPCYYQEISMFFKIIHTDRIAEISQSYQNSTSTHRRYNLCTYMYHIHDCVIQLRFTEVK